MVAGKPLQAVVDRFILHRLAKNRTTHYNL
jgi:hypothetical protein